MFAHTADVYAPDDAGTATDGMIRTTTDIQRLDPHSNVPAINGPPSALVAVGAIIAIIAAVHYFGKGGRKR